MASTANCRTTRPLVLFASGYALESQPIHEVRVHFVPISGLSLVGVNKYEDLETPCYSCISLILLHIVSICFLPFSAPLAAVLGHCFLHFTT